MISRKAKVGRTVIEFAIPELSDFADHLINKSFERIRE